ncbi:hypothetical protein BO94DRAFT_529961 [Aspergillus sclerotioniger CBS 115572]|uniref:Uncharacterized protein n=1 Tax=Aspergillus sclerotioniger CBS 115572 TaxID=1450535 RepID=A0A317XDK3_9EURO|nr:hypothetical protein BO94DRAFT_529961 [Aspergillus sclerotioniger CBS 115572]PWY96593.1 hypothetical protein BO94DRAFT_529961 [Aspergillus sclerotioniger CBS 115572]
MGCLHHHKLSGEWEPLVGGWLDLYYLLFCLLSFFFLPSDNWGVDKEKETDLTHSSGEPKKYHDWASK